MAEKKFVVKVYAPDGTFKEALWDREFATVPEFSITINGGLSTCTLKTTNTLSDLGQIGRYVNAFLEPLPDQGDIVKIFIYDKEAPNGRQIYSGVMNSEILDLKTKHYEFSFGFLPNTIKLAKRVLRGSNGTDTTVSFNSVDPTDIVKAIVFRANCGIGYNPATIRETGLSRTYEFKGEYSLEAIKKVIDLLPAGWFFYVGGDDKVYLRNHNSGEPTITYWNQTNWGESYWEYDPATDSTVMHKLFVGDKAVMGSLRTDISQIVNKVIFMGGDTGGGNYLYLEKNNLGSQSEYGIYEKIVHDERVTDQTTAEYIMDRILKTSPAVDTSVHAVIQDSNFENGGYDIESLKVGDKVMFISDAGDYPHYYWGASNWGTGYWLYTRHAFTGVPMIIKKITYKFHSAELDCDIYPEPTSMRIEDVNRDLTNYVLKDAPATPTAL